MQSPTFSISLVRELRGSPLTVLIAFLLLEEAGQVPVSAQALKTVTGYTDHTIADSLRTLETPTRQLVARVTGGWRITTGFQLPLMFDPQNRDIRGNDLSSSSCSFNKNEQLNQGEEDQEETQNRDIRGFTANRAAALRAGIRDPKASVLAGLAHVSPTYIAAHVAKAAEEGHPIGTAIYRITSGWEAAPLVEKSPNGHLTTCKCGKCQCSRFTGDW